MNISFNSRPLKILLKNEQIFYINPEKEFLWKVVDEKNNCLSIIYFQLTACKALLICHELITVIFDMFLSTPDPPPTILTPLYLLSQSKSNPSQVQVPVYSRNWTWGDSRLQKQTALFLHQTWTINLVCIWSKSKPQSHSGLWQNRVKV